jgi:hypothetical protein
MGCQPLLPSQFLPVGESPLEGFLDKLRASSLKTPRPVVHKNTPLPVSLPPELLMTDFVQIRKDGNSPPLSQPYDGPYRVLRHSLHSFQLQVGSKMEEVFTHQLKVCRAPADTAPAVPPRRGRPPSKPFPSVGAQTPTQNPGEPTSKTKHGKRGGHPHTVQDSYLAQQRKLLEKIMPNLARSHYCAKNRRADRGL